MVLKFSTGEIIIDDIMWHLHRIKPFAASGKDTWNRSLISAILWLMPLSIQT